MNETKSAWRSGGLTLPLLILVVGGVVVIATRGGVAPSGGRDGRIVGDALELIREKYVGDVDSRKLAYEGIDGMLKSLDPYSEFFRPEEKSEFREETEGEFTGIGIVIDTSQRGPGVVVLYALSGSPSERVGIRSGDRILSTDGQPVDVIRTNQDLERVKKRLRGKVGTSVALRVQSPGEGAQRDVTVVREHIHDNSVRGPAILDSERGIGYLHVRTFNENTPRDFDAATTWLLAHRVKAMILDLRFNPGGLLKSATDLADRFLDHGVIVTTKGRDPASRIEYEASGKPKIPAGVAVVVLVNGESASASEVVAGALQDHRRALLVGSRTYGKGVVQTTVPFDRDRTLIKLTTARYYTPSGRCIEKLVGVDADRVGNGGILPDVEVTLTAAEAHAVAVRIGRLRALEDVLASGADARDSQRVDDRELDQAVALLRGEPATQALIADPIADSKSKGASSGDTESAEDGR